MEFGIAFANVGPFAEPEGAARFARAAEQAGFESIWTVEHVVVPAGYESTYPYDPSGKMPGPEESPIPDPLIWLAYLAAVTDSIKLATGVLILPQRNPIVLAKELATLDQMSGGRMLLGVGVGWLEEEFDAIGVPFRERGKRTDEHVAAMRALWTEEQASYDGEFVSFQDCISKPAPVQSSIPVHVGGHSDAAARRAGRLGDGFFPGKGSHEELARLFDLARATATEHGRDPDAIEMTT
ncbi:LLM class F420-dependent oxidoreductase, partial [cyanobacterium TDX16]